MNCLEKGGIPVFEPPFITTEEPPELREGNFRSCLNCVKESYPYKPRCDHDRIKTEIKCDRTAGQLACAARFGCGTPICVNTPCDPTLFGYTGPTAAPPPIDDSNWPYETHNCPTGEGGSSNIPLFMEGTCKYLRDNCPACYRTSLCDYILNRLIDNTPDGYNEPPFPSAPIDCPTIPSSPDFAAINPNLPRSYTTLGGRGYFGQNTMYPMSNKSTSGMICTKNGCEFISDIKRYISKNGKIENTLHVYTPDIFNKLRQGSVEFKSIGEAKRHFIEMYEVGGHGINRPMSIDEMYQAHNGMSSHLSKGDLIQMMITYEIEKSYDQIQFDMKSGTISNYCACELLQGLPLKSINIDFPFSTSPVSKSDTVRVNVIRGVEKIVARTLNGVVTTNSNTSSFKTILNKTKNLDTTYRYVNKRDDIVSNNEIGNCFLPNGDIIKTTQNTCVMLGGSLPENLDEFYRLNQKVRLKNKFYGYETRERPLNFNQVFDIDYNPNVFTNLFDSDPNKDYALCSRSNQTFETCVQCVERSHTNMCEESKGKHECWKKFKGNVQTPGIQKTPEYKSPYCGDMRYFCKDLTPFSVCGQGVSGDEIPRYRSATENSDTNDINTQQLPPQFYEPGLPDGKYNYINACCPESCSDCIFKAIRAAESGDHTNPNAPGIFDADGEYSQNTLGCNAVNKCDGPDSCCDDGKPAKGNTEEKCWSCGPYQIKKRYFDEAGEKYKNQHPACRALRNKDWKKELCKKCEGTDEEIEKCCKRKHDLSKLIIRCYMRRYTRNGDCQAGNCPCQTINSDGKQFTCEDIVRFHNGGAGKRVGVPCAQNRNATAPYWEKIKKALCALGGSCKRCINFDYSDCNNIKTLEYNCLFDDDPSRRGTQGRVRGAKLLSDTNTVPSDVKLKGNVGPFSYQGTDTKTGKYGYYYPLYLTPEAARKANPNALNNNYFHTHSFTELPNYTFYMPNNANNHGVASNGGFTEFKDIRQRIPTFFSKNTPDSLYIPYKDDSTTIEPLVRGTIFSNEETVKQSDLSSCTNSTTTYKNCLECVDASPFVSECVSAIKRTRCYYKYNKGAAPSCNQVRQHCKEINESELEGNCLPGWNPNRYNTT